MIFIKRSNLKSALTNVSVTVLVPPKTTLTARQWKHASYHADRKQYSLSYNLILEYNPKPPKGVMRLLAKSFGKQGRVPRGYTVKTISMPAMRVWSIDSSMEGRLLIKTSSERIPVSQEVTATLIRDKWKRTSSKYVHEKPRRNVVDEMDRTKRAVDEIISSGATDVLIRKYKLDWGLYKDSKLIKVFSTAKLPDRALKLGIAERMLARRGIHVHHTL